ncbi:exopolyphosphatase [Flavobacterium sp. ZT3R18]|uniref:Ppx/GppA phosphatase family protein n=1 Tax=Flavobacterium sp. ZT3R18 TaxID=2594429 RepID=UPI00117B7DB6|nr:exopolyphosphatase [Flavobacterium sp. ZT3R18]TRX38585.1 exopolyphosphatase [Flavobacterium sp. ZT3R18]
MKEKFYFSIICLILSYSSQAQLYGGIEIGSKGIKMTVLDVENLKRNTYDVKEFWTENVGIAAGIGIDGALLQEDIDKAGTVVANNYKRMLTDYRIEDKNIFIVASSGVGLANNTNDLVLKIKEVTNKKIEIISSSLEAKLLLRGCIPPKNYLNSVIIDIGGGNTKGGYAKEINGSSVFFPISCDLGTVTLTELINKKCKQKTIFEFSENLFDYLPTMRESFKKMYTSRPESQEKSNVYISGGAAWAFYTLTTGIKAEQNFTQVQYDDILAIRTIAENNYQRFVTAAESNVEMQKVLKTYQQKSLIAAFNLLETSLEVIPNVQNKKIFFAKQGQIAWLVSYVFDNAKGVKQIN